jgi:hypothetical protein
MRIEYAVRDSNADLGSFSTSQLNAEKNRLQIVLGKMVGSLYPQFVAQSIDRIDAELTQRTNNP